MLRTMTVVGVLCALWTTPALAKKHRHAKHPPPAAAAPAAAPVAAPAPAQEKVEEVEAVEPVDAKPAEGEAGANKEGTPKGDAPLGPVDYIGHMHSAVVHLPIAWMLLLLLVDGAAWGLGREELVTAGLYLTGLALLSYFPAAVTGLVRVTQLSQDPESLAPALLHRNVMYGCAALTAVLLGIRVRTKNVLEGPIKWVYLALLGITVGLVSLGGHLGGKLVFGDDFLPF